MANNTRGGKHSGCHELSENIWFVWSKISYSALAETMWDVTLCDAWTKECEDKASILKAGFATNEFRGLNRLI